MGKRVSAFTVGIVAIVTLAATVLLCSVLSVWQSCSGTLDKVNTSADTLFFRTLQFEETSRGIFADLNSESVAELSSELMNSILLQTSNAWDTFVALRVGTLGALASAIRREGAPYTVANLTALANRVQEAFGMAVGTDTAGVAAYPVEAESTPAYLQGECLNGPSRVILQSKLYDAYLPHLAVSISVGTLSQLRSFAPGMPLSKLFSLPNVTAAIAAAGGNISAVPDMWTHSWVMTEMTPEAPAVPLPLDCVVDDRCGRKVVWDITRKTCYGGATLPATQRIETGGAYDLWFHRTFAIVKEWIGVSIFARAFAAPTTPQGRGRTLAYMGTYFPTEAVSAMLKAAVGDTKCFAYAIMPTADLEVSTSTIGADGYIEFVYGGVLRRRLAPNGTVMVAVSDDTSFKEVFHTDPTTMGALIPMSPADSASREVAAVGALLPRYSDYTAMVARGGVVELTARNNVTYFARAMLLQHMRWVLVVAVREEDLLGRLWSSAANATSARAALRGAMSAQRESDLTAASTTLHQGVGVAVAVAAGVSLLLALAAVASVRRMASEFGALEAAMRRSAQLESVFDDAAISAQSVSRVEEVAGLQLAYRQISRAMYSFARYLPVEVCRVVAASDRPATLGLEPREVTILFCDIADFTTISERFAGDLAAFSECLAAYFEEATDAISALNGAVDKFIGDAVMALWGAVEPTERGGVDAVAAAIRLQHLVREVGRYWALKLPGAALHVRSGVNLGRCLVGNIGSSGRFNFTALGDPVNLASRLEGANKAFGTSTLVSEAVLTAPDVAQSFPYRLLCAIAVKGRATAVRVYDVPDRVLDEGNAEAVPVLADVPELDTLLMMAEVPSAESAAPVHSRVPSVLSYNSKHALSDGGSDCPDGPPGSAGPASPRSHHAGPTSPRIHPASGAGDVEAPPISHPSSRAVSPSTSHHPASSRPAAHAASPAPRRRPGAGGSAKARVGSGQKTAEVLRKRRLREIAELVVRRGSNVGAADIPKLAVVMTKAHLAQFTAAAEAYLARNFGAAAAGFADLYRMYPRDYPTVVLLEEVRRASALDPGVWDGAFHMTTK